MKRCPHNSGWWTPGQNVTVFVDTDRTVSIADNPFKRRERQKVVLVCNISGCGAQRHAYFDATGRLVKVTRPYRPAAKASSHE
jgi:hypothetical protein